MPDAMHHLVQDLALVLCTAALVTVVEGTRFVKDVLPMVDESKLAALRQVAIGLGLIFMTVYSRNPLRKRQQK